jgi:hypothetical protein
MTVLEKLNSIVPGWTTYPDGTIYTNPNPGGGIIDVSWGTNKQTFNRYLSDWIEDRGTKGIRDDAVWYSPESILRIEMGESQLEEI